MAEVVLGGRYRLQESIGEGGMAVAYLAHDQVLDRRVVVKVLREEQARDRAFLERFHQEARAAAGLSHPNIVTVHDVGADQGYNYIVMEYVEGVNLKEMIRREAPFSNAHAVDLATQLLAAVGSAHRRHIVHRDLKPQNIVVTKEGQLKVLDFGIARIQTQATSQLTEAGMVMGTPHYCSPEQAMGQPATPASDIYAAGVILYEMVTGRLPFEGDSPVAVAIKQIQETPPPPRHFNPGVSPSLEAIILRALDKEPTQRYVTAEAMRDALTACQRLGEQATIQWVAPPPSPEAEAARPRGGWVPVVLSILIALFLVAWIPLVGFRLYQVYFQPLVSVVAPTPTAPVVNTPVGSWPTPTPSFTANVVAVPNLVGKPYDEAQKELAGRGLEILVSEEQSSDQYEVPTVLSQTVEAGAEVAPGTAIGVVVSKPSPRVVVPNVLRRPRAEAEQQLKELGFQVTVKEAWDNEVAAGLVLTQDPQADRRVPMSSVVVLIISSGPEPPDERPTVDLVTVPDVVYLSEEEARRRIEEAGLRVIYPNYQRAEDVTDKKLFYSVQVGHVLSQSLSPGIRVQRGTIIYIAIRKE